MVKYSVGETTYLRLLTTAYDDFASAVMHQP
jgi:hypothetical protein